MNWQDRVSQVPRRRVTHVPDFRQQRQQSDRSWEEILLDHKNKEKQHKNRLNRRFEEGLRNSAFV